DRPDPGRRTGVWHQRMGGEEWCEMLFDPYRAHTRTSAPMRDGERLVEIEVSTIRSEDAGSGQTDHGVEIGPVYIDLTTVTVDDLGETTNPGFEHTVCGRIGDHHRGETV